MGKTMLTATSLNAVRSGLTLKSGSEPRAMLPRDWYMMPGQAGATVLFLLGRPGSGKSTVYKMLIERLGEYRVHYYDDYMFLRKMMEAEKKSGRSGTTRAKFRPLLLKNGRYGFEVLDFSVLQSVLYRVNACVKQHLYEPQTFILVELARDFYDHEHVWRYFNQEVRMSARYLYCNSDLPTCIERVEKRAQHIPREVMESYYSPDALPSLYQSCGSKQVKVVNTGETVLSTQRQVLRSLSQIL